MGAAIASWAVETAGLLAVIAVAFALSALALYGFIFLGEFFGGDQPHFVRWLRHKPDSHHYAYRPNY